MKFTADATKLEHFYDKDVPHTAVLVCNFPCNMYGYQLENNHTAAVHVNFYNAASAGEVTPGVTPVVLSVKIPANDGVVIPPSSLGPLFRFTAGLVVSATLTREGADDVPTDPTVQIWFCQV
jgi:hypothetical protein